MKKTLITLMALAISVLAHAQTEQGKHYVGGNLAVRNYNISVTGSKIKGTGFTIAPTLGFFVSKNLSVAITPTYQYSKDTTTYFSPFTGSSVSKSGYLGGSVDVRYYINITPQFAFYPQLSAGYLGMVGVKNTTGSSTNVGISPNLSFFPSKNWSLNFTFGLLQYRRETTTFKETLPGSSSENKSVANYFNFSGGGFTGIGINYFFGK